MVSWCICINILVVLFLNNIFGYNCADTSMDTTNLSNSSTDAVLTLLIPAQTAIIEALIFAFKSISGSYTFRCLVTETQTASFNVLVTTCIVLSLTLSICNAVLDLSKAQKISGSIALVTQAAIVMSAQLKNITNDKKAEMLPVTPETNEDINRVVGEEV